MGRLYALKGPLHRPRAYTRRSDGDRELNARDPRPFTTSGYDLFSFHTASGANTSTSPSDHSSEGHR
jgi:hypothetical protein